MRSRAGAAGLHRRRPGGARLAIVAVALPALAASEPGAGQPRSFASPSGALELRVEPVERLDAGPARCELRRAGDVVWARELDFAPVCAAVLEDGRVACGGQPLDREGRFPDEVGGDARVVLLDERGEVRWTRELPVAPGLHAASPARARHVAASAERDRVAVVAGPDWLSFRLSDGRPGPSIALREVAQRLGEAWRWWPQSPARPIPGTPLDLVVLEREPEPAPDDRWRAARAYALVDGTGRPVWHVVAVEAEAREGERVPNDFLLRTVLAADERSFALWDVRAGERVDYRVAQEDGAWTAAEVARAPHDGRTARERAALAVPVLELELLASEPLREDELPARDPSARFTAPNGGELSWELRDGKQLLLRDASGRARAVHDRRPGDRRWLEVRAGGMAVAADGAVALLSEGRAEEVRVGPQPPPETALVLFSPDGRALRTIPLPVDAGEGLDFDGRRAVVARRVPRVSTACRFEPSVLVVDAASGEVRRFTPRVEGLSERWSARLPPGGRELRIADVGAGRLHRFALPAEGR